MFRIIDDQCSGKTGRLMLLAKETGATIVCNNPYAMKQKANAYGIVGVEFITYAQALDKGPAPANFLIDEIESFVKYTINGNLIGYTLTNKD